MSPADQPTDVLLRVRGIVQGVGFRPFVHRTARELGLRGWVRNDDQGVLIRAAGREDAVDQLMQRLREQPPPAALVQSVTSQRVPPDLAPLGEDFVIVASESSGLVIDAAIPPDLALCAECRTELFAPENRRHRYPFINCTQCGPRYSILENLPYDRPRTTMRAFRQCPACQREYDEPTNRRFHAQPNACAVCGPRVSLSHVSGERLAEDAEAISQTAEWLRNGAVAAVKGIGGYHLFVDATAEVAVTTLRHRKHRDEKPLAVMFRDLAAVRAVAEVSDAAATRLSSPAAPIVLVRRRTDTKLAPSVAPGNPWIGALLAYSPLHVLLLAELDFPVVATSANHAEEPLCTDPTEAHERLAGIADVFLDHDRPIAHPVDDSVVRYSTAGPIILRRARGYAPAPIPLPAPIAGNWLCVGAQMKSVVSVAAGDRIVLSPHIGDLAGVATLGAFRRTIDMLAELHGTTFTAVACDKHPDYASTRFARGTGLPCVAVQHHLAHVLACLLEHHQTADGVLGVALDGTGYGEDGTIWGGEFILFEKGLAHRFGRVRPFRLAGGEAAVRDPRRVALALLHETADPHFHEVAHTLGLPPDDATVLNIMLSRGLNSPVTSSAGRLFDAVGALLGLGRSNHFEGQTPLAVEAAATAATAPRSLPFPVRTVPGSVGAICELDWQPLVEHLLTHSSSAEVAALAAGFHVAFAHAITEVARRSLAHTVALSGGCFQNALLLGHTVAALQAAGFKVLTHRELPPNDGNIAAGQALGALWGLASVTLP